MSISERAAREKIIVALDVPGRDAALQLVEKLSGEVGAFKIGMQLYNAEGPAIVRDITAAGGSVFLDLKFHDIPNTVAEATRVVTGLGAAIMNVHAAGGVKMMAAAAAAAAEEAAQAAGVAKPLVTAVTVLTSLSQPEFEEEVGIKRPIAEQVIHWAGLAKAAGLDGVVASAREITAIRQACGPDFVIITPGLYGEPRHQKISGNMQ